MLVKKQWKLVLLRLVLPRLVLLRLVLLRLVLPRLEMIDVWSDLEAGLHFWG